jgi:hypothetical protein
VFDTILKKRLQGIKPKERINRESVPLKATKGTTTNGNLTEKRVTVGGRRRSDITTLGVDNKRDILGADSRAQFAKDGKTRKSVLLEKGDVRFDAGDLSLNR